MLVLLMSVAFGKGNECAWTAEFDSVTSNMTTVSIDGEQRTVVGRTNWSRLSRELHDCDIDAAASKLERWRAKRRTTNTMVGLGFITGITWFVAPFTAMAAGKWRTGMEDDLIAWDGPEAE